jgi:hypothetical protein
MRTLIRLFLVFLFTLMIILPACIQKKGGENSYHTDWLGSSRDEVYSNIEEQFQGFSRTMVEVSQRYHELYWAGQDENWQFAAYQHEHIEEALEQGFKRRPEREFSARSFMTVALPAIEEAIHSENQQNFTTAFTQMTNSCNTCHQMEEVVFIQVGAPMQRNTVVRF